MVHKNRFNKDSGYVEFIRGGNRRKPKTNFHILKWSNIQLVKYTYSSNNNYCGYINMNGKKFSMPKEYIGKRVRIKIEIVE